MDITVNPKISIGDVFYTVDHCVDVIVAHRCVAITLSNTITNNSVETDILYTAKDRIYKYSESEICASFEEAERELYGE